MRTTNPITGYHFTADRLRNGDPIPPIGEWIKCAGPIQACVNGLHASEHPFDALKYAPGPRLHRIELRGELESHGKPVDKWAGRERRILASIDAGKILNSFARGSASLVLNLWDAPDIVKQYLDTGDETIRLAAAEAAGIRSLDPSTMHYERFAINAAWFAATSEQRIENNGALNACYAFSYALAVSEHDSTIRSTISEFKLVIVSRFALMVHQAFNDQSKAQKHD